MGKSVRTTFSLPAEQHDELLKIAEESHVSAAWVVREAVRLYLRERYPLLPGPISTDQDMNSATQNKKRRH